MKPLGGLRAAFTVPNYHQLLTASRPIQVYTYFFGTGGPAPEPAIGPVHIYAGAQQLVPHDHEHHEFAVVLAGTATHRTIEGARRIARGSMMVLAPSDVHALDNIHRLWLLNCTYLTEYLFYDLREILSVEGLAPLFFHGSISGGGTRTRIAQWELPAPLIESCMREMGDIAAERARNAPSPVFMRRTLEKLMLLLHRSFMESGEPGHVPVGDQVSRALDRIEEIMLSGDSFDAGSLASEMRISVDRLARLFRRATGRTPTDYYQHRRVQQASCLLLDGTASVTQVAHDLGFYDAAHFSRIFKRYRGIGPKAFQMKYADR